MKIYLIRHGQTTGDIEDRYGGDYDDHLTDLGHNQGVALAEKLKAKGIEIIFASSLIRAQQTAKILNEKLKVKIKTVGNLRERNQNGILTGMIRSEAKEKYPELVERLKNYQDTIEGAESFEHFTKRVKNAFLKIAKMEFKTVAIVTHGGPIRRIYTELLGVNKEIKIADCAYALLEVKGKKVKVLEEVGIKIL